MIAPTLLEHLVRHLERTPDRRLYTFLDQAGRVVDEVDYQTLVARAAGAADLLTAAGVARGDRVLLVFPPDGLEFVIAFFGCVLCGAVPVPTPSPDPRALERDLPLLRHVASDCDARVALTHARYRRLGRIFGARDLLRGLVKTRRLNQPAWPDVRWITIDRIRPAAPEAARRRLADAAQATRPDDVAFLQYTSGSTSQPRGVVVRHRNLAHNLMLIARNTEVTPDSVLVSWVPLFHDMGLTGGILNAAATGSRCVYFSPMTFLKNPGLWLDAIERYRGTHACAPNFGFEYVLRAVDERPTRDLSSWVMALQGGEPMRAATMDRVAERLAPFGFRRAAFSNIYGMAESVLFVTGRGAEAAPALSVDAGALEQGRVVPRADAGEHQHVVIGCGVPDAASGVAIAVVDPDTRQRRPAGAVGELWLHSPSVSDGYWGKPDADNAAQFRARIAGDPDERTWLRTGDLGFVHDGEVYLCGRHKDLLIVAGRNVHPQDLEITLEGAHVGVRKGNVACFGVEIDATERLVVVAEARDDAPLGEVAEALRTTLARDHHLTAHEILLIAPRSLPKTTSGKVQRGQCRQRWQAGEFVARHRLVPSGESTPRPPASAAPALTRAVTRAATRAEFLAIVGEVAGLSTAAPPEARLQELGLDSIQAVEICERARLELGLDVDATILLQNVDLAAAWVAIETGEGTRCRVAAEDEPAAGVEVDVSLMFFSSQDRADAADRYATFMDAVRRADRGRLHAIWLPERHFHAFGGLFPNPSVLASAVAATTRNIRIRAGSVVMPLHDPIRVAEEWAVVDNLSGGRVDLAFASGWHQNDFVLAPTRYGRDDARFLADIDAVRRLWRGEAIERVNGRQATVEIAVHPRPVQPELVVWHTAARAIERFEMAGRAGANVLTALLFRRPEEVGEAVAVYRAAREAAGFDPATGRVTLMMHTCVGTDDDAVMDAVRAPFRAYLESSIDLWRQFSSALDATADMDPDALLDYAFARYARTSALFGTPGRVAQQMQQLKALGVDEIACLVDFGVDDAVMLRGVDLLAQLQRAPVSRSQVNRPQSTAAADSDLAGFYDALSAQSERQGAERRYLTFGAFDTPPADFNWVDALYRPAQHPTQAAAGRAGQTALRARFLDGVDLGAVRRVLDIGCGYGSDLIELALAHPGLEAWGQTLSPEQARLGQARADAAGVGDRVHVQVGDSTRGLPPGPFDLVIGFEVACYIEDKAALLDRIAGRLAPGGALVLADFCATGAQPLVHAETSSFMPTVDTWASLWADAGLALDAATDLSRPVAHFLALPDAEAAFARLAAELPDGAAVLPHLRAWERLGRGLARGLIRYQTWTLRPGVATVAEARARVLEAPTVVLAPAASEETARLPLAGVTVLDLSRLLPAAQGTDLLRQMGAEVIKVELPGSGDYMRVLDDPTDDAAGPFRLLNAGKKSIALNYRNRDGAEALRQLVSTADVLVESDLPGNLARFGLDPVTLRRLNPRLIVVSVTAWGQTGPWARRPAHEMNIEATTGYLALTAQLEGRPTPAPIPIADLLVGPFLAAEVNAALIGVRATGHGCHIDLAAADKLRGWVRLFSGPDGVRDPFAQRWPNYQCVETADGGWLAIGALEKPFWDLLCQRIERPEWRSRAFDPTLIEPLRACFAQHTLAEWLARFEGAAMCVTPVLGVGEAMRAPQARARAGAEPGRAPTLGEHTASILARLQDPAELD